MAGRSKFLEHDFDNDDLTCGCGTTLQQFQKKRTLCPLERPRRTRAVKPTDTPLNALRKAMGVPLYVVAYHCDVSEETVRRSLTADGVGGKFKTAPSTAQGVRQFVLDLAEGSFNAGTQDGQEGGGGS